jgi:GH24 family phage-related lysozyme (muramidase)
MSEFDDNLRRQVISDEGFRLFPALPEPLHISYRDHLGLWTIGHGFNLDDPNAAATLAKVTRTKTIADLRTRRQMLTFAEGHAILDITIANALRESSGLVKNFDKLSGPRRLVVASMLFQMGRPSLSRFKNMIAALNAAALSDKAEDWAKVVAEMENSKWARQTPERAKLMIKAMKDNVYPKTSLSREVMGPPVPPELPGPPVPPAKPSDGSQGHNNPRVDFPKSDPPTPRADPPDIDPPKPPPKSQRDDDPDKPIPLGPFL